MGTITNPATTATQNAGSEKMLSLCAAYPDASTADLAQMMTISNSTVRNLLSSVYLRLGVHSRTAAVEKAREMGLVTPRPPSFTS